MTQAPVAGPTRGRVGRADVWQPALLLAAIAFGLATGAILDDRAAGFDRFVPIGVFGLLYLVLLNVRVGNALAVFTERRFLVAALVINFVVNPGLAWLLAETFLAGHPELATGLVLFLVTPCIGWYLVFTELAGGSVSLGVGVLLVNLVLQVALLPLYLRLLTDSPDADATATVARSVVIFLVVPGLLAGLTRRWCRVRAIDLDVVQGRVRTAVAKPALLALVIAAMFASQTAEVLDNLADVGRLVFPVTSFFVVTFALALATGTRLDLGYGRTALLAVTTTSRNSEASLAIAATAFASPLVSMTVVVGPMIELPLLVVMLRVLERRRQSVEP